MGLRMLQLSHAPSISLLFVCAGEDLQKFHWTKRSLRGIRKLFHDTLCEIGLSNEEEEDGEIEVLAKYNCSDVFCLL